MIAFLPELYPDELLSSFCARYQELMGYRSRECTGRDLFGKERAKAAFDLPSNLAALVKRVPFTNWKTLDHLIDQHTLLPFYAPFVSPHKLSRIRADMAIDEGGTIHARLGVLTHSIRVENFRYCSECVESDRSMFGETYWHRLHQLSGIDVCPAHRTFLNDSSLHTRHRGNREAFVTAEKAITTLTSKEIDAENEDHLAYVKLAEDAKWLLENALPANTNNGNHQRYLALLYERGLAGYDGPVKLKVLSQRVRTHYSEELLTQFHCSLSNTHNWITRLIHSMDKSQQPIEHLLLIRFLACTVAEFFNTTIERLPFGEGPWPCLNPTCNQFRRPAIDNYELSQTPVNGLSKEPKNTGHPVGNFSCKCGFKYYRVGPDKRVTDRYHANGFVCITKPWIESFRETFNRKPLPNDLAKQSCTTPETALQMIRELKLAPSRVKKRISIAGECFEPSIELRLKKKVRRGRWIQALAASQCLSRGEMYDANKADFQWLVLNDRKWLYRHLPPRRISHGPGFRTDWSQEDKVLSREVQEEAKRIRTLPGKPIRASPTLIATSLGKLAFITKRGHLIPRTIKALSQSSETIEEFAIRRIHHKAESLRKEGLSVPAWKLQNLAAVSDPVARQPRIRKILERCANDLRKVPV